MVSPFIKPLQTSGGTFYSFTSSTEDLGLTFNSSTNKFRFSKFVLLNIPNIKTPSFGENGIQFASIDGALIQGLDADNNINLAQSFQNYCLNMESLVISASTYDRSLKQNVSERVFWKWMKEIGAIRFADANSLQSTLNTSTDPRFVEETEVLTGSERYNRMVQYIGDIQIVNSIQNNVNAYSEIYIHIPTSDGNTPLIMFKSVEDANYGEGMTFQNRPADPLDNEIINGRHYSDTHPAGLSINAIYDQDIVGSPSSLFYNSGTEAYDIVANWYDPLVGPNAYFTEATFGDASTDIIKKTEGLTEVNFKRSRLDGIQIDFDVASYKPIADNASITTFQEYNSTSDAQAFEFNAVLVYYDVYDPNNEDDVATNLYGVLFLEDVEQLSTEYGIPRFKKFRPNAVTKLNGNSYGFKINVKFDTSIDNVGIVEKAINDYSTFSLELYVDALNALQQSAEALQGQTEDLIDIKSRMTELEDLVINIDNINELDLRITTLEDSMLENQALFNNTNTLVTMINNMSDEFNEIMKGNTSISVSYNADVIKQGSGITVDRSVANQVTINNSVQKYTITSAIPYQGDMSGGGTLTLQPFNNYFRHYANGSSLQSNSDIYIRIDDSLTTWKRGQTFRIVFEDVLDMQSYSIIFQTDAPNRKGTGYYGVLIGAVSGTEFDDASDRPIFDITCVDETTLTFIIDQIR